MTEEKLKLGMIGIGAMGTPMSMNLIEAGFPLTVYDRDPERLKPLEALGETSVRSPHLTHKGRMMIERDFDPAFMLKYMQKDFDLIMEAAHALNMPVFTSAMAHQVYTAANAAGYGERDYSSVVQFLEQTAGLQ